MKNFLFFLSILFSVSRAICQDQTPLPPTTVQVTDKLTLANYEAPGPGIPQLNIKDPQLKKFLINAEFDQFITRGKELLKAKETLKEEKEMILQTIIQLHAIRYQFAEITALKGKFDVSLTDPEVSWEEAAFYGKYKTVTTFPDTAPVSIPLKWSSAKTPVIEVEISGHKFLFWLDTGASGSVVSNAVASKILMYREEIKTKTSGGATEKTFETRAAVIPALSIGKINIQNLPVAVIDSSDLTLAPGITIDGIIGLPFLFQLDVTIDVSKSKIILKKASDKKNTIRNFFWLGYPFAGLLTENGQQLYWGFDTGAGTSRMKAPMMDKLGDKGKFILIEMQESGIGGLSEKYESYMLEKLALTCNNKQIIYSNIKLTSPEGVNTPLIDADGKLGSDVLKNCKGIHFSIREGVFRFIE